MRRHDHPVLVQRDQRERGEQNRQDAHVHPQINPIPQLNHNNLYAGGIYQYRDHYRIRWGNFEYEGNPEYVIGGQFQAPPGEVPQIIHAGVPYLPLAMQMEQHVFELLNRNNNGLNVAQILNENNNH